mmetsp:Transcript_4939/g.13144  ORF Transcript_4939/g.13144 Transcript_4939/m.13144 type:complete len:211 (+) Transcript_4939:233-865(+)
MPMARRRRRGHLPGAQDRRHDDPAKRRRGRAQQGAVGHVGLLGLCCDVVNEEAAEVAAPPVYLVEDAAQARLDRVRKALVIAEDLLPVCLQLAPDLVDVGLQAGLPLATDPQAVRQVCDPHGLLLHVGLQLAHGGLHLCLQHLDLLLEACRVAGGRGGGRQHADPALQSPTAPVDHGLHGVQALEEPRLQGREEIRDVHLGKQRRHCRLG